jgi:acetolactate synthase I/II/III large subunit
VRASDHVAEALHRHGVRHVFQVAGGTIAHLVDAIHRAGRVSLVSTHHEQAAAFAADGAARMTGVPGVAMGTSGPGATNLLTGVASCHFDSVPAVFVCGQVHRDELRRDRAVRQQGFQETDVVAMAAPVAKAAWRLGEAAEIPARLAEAFALAVAGRPGPVVLDVPMDLQHQDVAAPGAPAAAPAPAAPDPDGVRAAMDALAAAERPLVLAGGGVRAGGAGAALRAFAEATGIPVATSLMAVDALPAGHPERVGMIGTYGNRWANLAVGRADALLVVGSRLDIRQTGADTAFITAGRVVHHVDVDPAEINNRVRGCTAHVGDAGAFLTAAAGAAAADPARYAAWRDEIAGLRARWPDDREQVGIAGIDPNRFMHALGAASGAAAAYVVDVGQHQMWAAQSIPLADGQRFLSSGGMGAMGFALPAALGASLTAGAPVVVVAGDGGFQVNVQELQTVVETGAPLKMVVLDNGAQGMVRQFQESYFDGRYPATVWGYSAPDFAAVARAYGIEAATVADPADVERGLAALWRDPGRPALLVVRIDPAANAYPKIAFGRPLTEMEPHATPIALDR